MKKKRILLGLGAFAFLGLALTSCDDYNKMYQVTFYSGTEKLDTKEVKYGYNVAVPEMPQEDGKIFNGWYKDAELTEEFNFGDIITGNVSIYARWLNEFTVTFKNGDETLKSETVINGQVVSKPENPTQANKVFKGWYSDSDFSVEYNFEAPITANTTLFAKWENEYVVTFKNGEETLKSETVISGQVVSKPENPTQANKVFKGWYSDSDFSVEYNFEAPITANTTLFAKWENEYVVTFKNGEENIYSQNVQQGAKVEQHTAPEVAGKTFVGWFKDAEFTESFNFDEVISTDTVIYAKYVNNTYTVSFSTANGTKPDDLTEVNVLPETLPTLEATGFAFEGWYLDEAFETKAEASTQITANTTLYAKWVKLNTVTFKNGDAVIETKEVKNGSKAEILNAPELDEKVFVGWFKDEALTESFDFDTEILENTTIFAKYVEKTYKVTYSTSKGETPEDVVEVNALPETLPVLEATGYAFDGWYLEDTFATKAVASTEITEDTTLYAKWIKKDFEFMSASENKVFADDFTETQVKPQSEYKALDKGVYNLNIKEGLDVSAVEGKLVGTDTNDKETTKATIQLGYAYSGVLEGTFKYTPTHTENKTAGKMSFVQFKGYKTVGTNSTLLFAIRTNADKKVGFYYKDGETEVFGDVLVDYTPGTEYEVYFKYDFATSKVYVTFGDNVLANDVVLPESVRHVFLTDVEFDTATDAKRGFKVDDFAVINEDTATLEQVKAVLKVYVDETVASILSNEAYSFSKASLEKELAEFEAQLATVESKEDTLKLAMYAFSKVSSLDTNDQIKTRAKESLEKNKQSFASNYTYSTTKAEFEKVFVDSNALIDNATSKDQIITILNDVSKKISNIKVDDSIRNDINTEFAEYYKETCKILDSLSTTERSSASVELADISHKYDKGINGVFATCSMDEIDSELVKAKKELDDVKTKYSETLEKYEEKLAKDFEDYKTKVLEGSGYKEEDHSYFFAGIKSIKIDFTGITTKDDAKKAFDNSCKVVENKFTVYASELKADEEINKYVADKVATLLDQETYKAKYQTDMDDLLTNILDGIYMTLTTEDVDLCVEKGKANVDALIAKIKDATEVTIKFFDGETELTDLAASIIKGSKVTKPTDPTKDGFKFKGWYSDETTEFDFENDVVDSNTTLNAKWLEKITATVDFKSITQSDANKTNVTKNFNTKETFTVKDSKNNDFVVSTGDNSKSKNKGYLVNSSKGLRIKNEEENEYISFTLTETADVVIVLNQDNKAERGIDIFNGETKYLSVVAADASVEGYTATGDVVFDASKDTGTEFKRTKGKEINIKMSNCAAGTYYIKINSGHGGDIFITSISTTVLK